MYCFYVIGSLALPPCPAWRTRGSLVVWSLPFDQGDDPIGRVQLVKKKKNLYEKTNAATLWLCEVCLDIN